MSVPIEKKNKLSPRLRMILNGDTTVNTLRAEQNPALAVSGGRAKGRLRRLLTGQIPRFAAGQFRGRLERKKLRRIPSTIYTSVLIRLKDDRTSLPRILADLKKEQPQAGAAGISVSEPLRRGDVVSAVLPLDCIPGLLKDPRVVAVESPGSLAFLPPIQSTTAEDMPGEPPTSLERWDLHKNSAEFRLPESQPGSVLIGIIDVQGFDFAHPDFLDEQGITRFEAIWDQAGTFHPAPAAYGYGSELTGAMLNRALASQVRYKLPATQLEPQSEMVPGSHGTHVASIAAGNHGLCPNARIAAVLLSLGSEDADRRASFYDSTRLLHAVDYLFKLGSKLGLPVAINISLGTNGHAHDGTGLLNRWLDYELTTPGRAVCVAAGNAGQEASLTPGDLGYILGRIHTSGRLELGKPTEVQWEVIGNGITDISENELEIWFSECDHFSVQVKPPYGDWTTVVKTGEYIENKILDSKTVLSVYNELFVPVNGLNYIACYLSPFFSETVVVGIQSGTWQVRLIPESIRDGRYHGWIERDDPYRYNRLDNNRQVWAFPSYFNAQSNVDSTSVTSLACGQGITSIANFDAGNGCIHPTSSKGPTRDGRFKPDVAAPGTEILAARGFAPADQSRWLSLTGTSMACPYVTGVIAAMLALDPGLNAAQVNGILHHTARPLKSCPEGWEDASGFGIIDPPACLGEVSSLQTRKDLR